jgi:hypothetical protein
MGKKGTPKKKRLDELVDECWTCHIEKGMPYPDIFKYFKANYGYGKDYIYKIIQAMQVQAKEYMDKQNVAKLETQISIGQSDYLASKIRGDYKLATTIWIEINKLFELYKEKHEHTIKNFNIDFDESEQPEDSDL